MNGKDTRPRRFFPTAVLVSALLLASTPRQEITHAAGLLDLLRKKGILAEGEYKRLKKADHKKKGRPADRSENPRPPLNIGYKDGLKIESVDKKHELRIGTEIYTQFSAFPRDAEANGNFLLRRGRVTFQGRLFRDFTYRLTLAGAGSSLLSSTTYVGWERYKAFRIRVGQHLAPFGAEALTSRFNLFFLERSMIGDNLRESVGRGVFVLSDPHPAIHLRAAVTNGTGDGDDDNSEKDFSFRTVGRPFRPTAWRDRWPIEVGANASVGRQPHNPLGGRTRLFLRDNRLSVFNAATEGLRTRLGVDIGWNKDYRKKEGLPLSTLAEIIYEIQEREGPTLGKGNGALIRTGYAVQAGVLLTGDWKKGGVELVARFDSIDMDDRSGSDNSENLPGQSVDTFGFGLNYRPIPAIRLSVNGFLFDIGQPITDAGDRDPFNNGGGAWAFLSGFYLKY